MNRLDQLLKNIPESQITDFQSGVSLYIKQIITSLAKNELFDISDVKARKYQCQARCYRKFALKSTEHHRDTIQSLRSCKNQCYAQKKAVLSFLKDIEFYSQRKLKGCRKKCDQMRSGSEEQNYCLWQCYGRLERRYKKYWKQQKENVMKSFI